MKEQLLDYLAGTSYIINLRFTLELDNTEGWYKLMFYKENGDGVLAKLFHLTSVGGITINFDTVSALITFKQGE